MKIAACLLALSAGVYSAAPADEPPSPAAQPAIVQPPSVPSGTSDAKPGDTKPAGLKPTDLKPADLKAADVNPVSAAAAAPAAKADNPEVAGAGPTEAQIKQMRGRGYKPVNRNGILVYCRSEGQIGTHFEKQRCSTMDELKNAELTGKEYVNSIQQQGSSTIFLKDPGPGH
jgi:hypothetical protein